MVKELAIIECLKCNTISEDVEVIFDDNKIFKKSAICPKCGTKLTLHEVSNKE